MSDYLKVLRAKFVDYLNEIPENVTYSILPLIRWQIADGGYDSVTISNSIKITRFSSSKLLAKKIYYSLQDACLVYDLNKVVIELFIMGRPWLDVDDFNVKLPELTDVLNKQLENDFEIRANYTNSDKFYYSTKEVKLKSYEYADIFINNYGDPILDKDNNLIGYKINQTDHASIETYYNDSNLLCNKVSIKEFDRNNLKFKPEVINYWIDIKTEFGFIREFNKKSILLR